MVIGITGGVGCGKSTVMAYLRDHCAAFLIECDEVARELQAPGGACYEPMVRLFGNEIVKPDGTIDRAKTAQIVFRDSAIRENLNAIVHPAVKLQVRERIERIQKTYGEDALIAVEAALLLDDHYEEMLDAIWYIYADESVRRVRLKKSRGYSDERITDMIRNQRSDESFRELTDLTIDNSSDDRSVTERQIRKALRNIGIM